MKHINRGNAPLENPVPLADGGRAQVCPAQPPRPAHRGGAYCAYCGAMIPKGNAACLICGAKRGGQPLIASRRSGGEAAWTEDAGTPQTMREARRRLSGIALLMIFFFLLSGGGVASYEYLSYQSLISQYTADGAALYRTQGGALRVKIPSLAEPLTITQAYTGGSAPLAAGSSADRRFVAYLNDRALTGRRDWGGGLYLLDLVSLSGGVNGGVLLENGVVDFLFLPADRLLYLTEAGDLYLCDFSALKDTFQVGAPTQETLLDSGVRGIGERDGRYLLYYKGERANAATWEENLVSEGGTPYDLYLINFEDPAAAPVPVGEGVYRVEDSMREYERIVYTKRTRSPALALYDVFVFHRGSAHSAQIARDARHVVDASAEKAAAYLLAPSEETLSFKDIVRDDLAASDLAISEPQFEDYVQEETFNPDTLDPAVLDEMYAQYDEAYALYEEKLARDQLRQSLRGDLRAFMQDHYLSFDLYHTNGEATTKLADHIYNREGGAAGLVWGSIARGTLLYTQGEREALAALTMSELDADTVESMINEDFNVMRYLSEGMPDYLWYVAGGEPQEVFLESGARHLDRYFVSADGAGIYFSSMPGYDTASGTLYYGTIANGEIGSVVYADEDVTDYIGIAGEPNPGLVYRKLARGGGTLRDISVISNGVTKVIATGTDPGSEVRLLGAADGILSYARIPEGQAASQLYLYSDQERFIASSVADLALYSADTIYLLRSEAGARQNLYLYRTGETTLVDEDVGDAVFLAEP